MLSYKVLPGSAAAPLAGSIWDNLPCKIQNACLFDIPLKARRIHLNSCWLAASHVCLAHDSGKIFLAAGWLLPVCPKSQTAFCHFIMTQNPDASAIAQKFSALALEHYSCLLCLVPAPYRSVRNMLANAGFQALTTLPNSCFLASRNRCVNGCLYKLERSQ